METPVLKSRGSLYASSTLCLLLIIFLSACNGSAKSVPPHHSQASGCTPIAAKQGAQGGDAALLATIPLPGQPFRAVGTDDGQWIFVSVDGPDAASSGIAVLHKTGGQVC
ncbi:MAG: hypothetical protein M3Z08_03995 [Chloroflexota bacterium]|nr:hypothetical protein [Chloroflexota bacterium]